MNVYEYITIVTVVLLIILILMQTRGANLGAGLGGGGEVNTERRGSDKSIHQLTIILVLIFCGSIMLGIVA
jgi:preprotein translocase subunit SecG